MKYLRTLLVTAMTALFIVGLAYAVTQTGFFGLKPQAAYARDYSPESLLNVPLLKEMIYSTGAENVVFTSDCLTEWNLYGVTVLQEFGRTVGAFDPTSNTLYIYPRDMSGWPAIAPEDCSGMFQEMTQLVKVDLRGLSFAQTTNMRNMFYGCSNLTTILGFCGDARRVTDMSGVFFNCSNLQTLDFGQLCHSRLKSEGVVNFSKMFCGCRSLKTIPTEMMDTSSAWYMDEMFYMCGATKLDLSGFDTSNVRNMNRMFYYCSYLQELDLSSFETANVYDFSEMFRCCRFLKKINMSNFSMVSGQVTAMRVALESDKLEEVECTSDIFKAFGFSSSVRRKKTPCEAIIAEGESLTISPEGAFYLNVYVDFSNDIFTAPNSQAFVRCTLPNGEVIQVDKNSEPVDQKMIHFVVCNGYALPIYAKDMRKNVVIEVFESPGKKIDGVIVSSIEEYAKALKQLYIDNKHEYANEIAKCIDALLVYGRYAEAYFDGKDTNPRGYTESTYDSYIYETSDNCSITDPSYVGSSLLLENKTILRHYFSEEIDGSVPSASHPGYYYIEKGFTPDRFQKSIDIVCYNPEKGYYSRSFDYTVDYYISLTLERSKDKRLKNLLCALHEYSYYFTRYWK